MNDRYGNRHGGGERWRERGRSDERGYGRGRDADERGFLDRAGDQLRSWFGDDDGREPDRPWERDERAARDAYAREPHSGENAATGWGNQAGQSWNRDRPGVRGGWDEERGDAPRQSGRGRPTGRGGGRAGGDVHDPHYSEWRQRQIEALDRDYADYRREHQSKFEQEFGSWRTRRGEQRQSLRKATEKMEVVGSDGGHIGTVDTVRGDRIILTRNDENAGGHHHSIPCAWIDRVEDKVIVDKTRDEAMRAWKDEEGSRALFESEDRGSDGPHVLDRSFRGTY